MSAPAFPLLLPFDHFADCTLKHHDRQAVGFLDSGRDFAVDRGGAWKGRWQTNRLTAADLGAAEAFDAALKGASRHFLGWDPMREYPLAYMPAGFPPAMRRHDGSTFDGTATLSAVNTLVEGRDGVALAGLPSGFIFSPGDKISFEFGAKGHSLHLVGDPTVTAASSGGAVTLWVNPVVPAAVLTGAKVHLHRARGRFRRIAAGDLTRSAANGPTPGEYWIEGISTLRSE